MNRLDLLFGLVLITLLSSNIAGAMPGKKYQEEASEVAKKLAMQLGAVMKEKMQAGGSVVAIEACSIDALRISSELSRETGWQVKRVATKVRNPLVGMPDQWEQMVLGRFESRHAKGESYKTMSYSQMIKEEDGRYFRYMRAIGVAPQCMTCHGSLDDMSEEIRQTLEEMYPHDQATGYSVGDLRGAISIKIPLSIQ